MTEVVDFGGLTIAFDDRLLRPRSWTQAQSRWAAEMLPTLPAGNVLELCAGAGQIGLLAMHAAARARPADMSRRLVCVDVDPVATEYVLRNAEAAGLGAHVDVRTGAMAEVLAPDERFPLIIADPPWVPTPQTAQYPEDPLLAIDGGEDGLSVARECLSAIRDHLAPGGVAVLQLGPGDDQADEAERWLDGTDLLAGERRDFERGLLLRIDRPA